MIPDDVHPDFWAASVRKFLDANPFQLPPYVRPLAHLPAAAAAAAADEPSKPPSPPKAQAEEDPATVPVPPPSSPPTAFYACIAVQSPATVTGFDDQQAQTWHWLKDVENKFYNPKFKLADSWRSSRRLPVYLSSAEESELLPFLRATRVHTLVWCALGSGLEASKGTGAERLSISKLMGVFQSHAAPKKPAVVVICMKYGARLAAESVAATMAGGTVVWIKADLLAADGEGVNNFFEFVVPIINIVEKPEQLTEEYMRRQSELNVPNAVAGVNFDIISPAAPGIARWEPSSAAALPRGLTVYNGAGFKQETNVDRSAPELKDL
jgi:hypothetical protein